MHRPPYSHSAGRGHLLAGALYCFLFVLGLALFLSSTSSGQVPPAPVDLAISPATPAAENPFLGLVLQLAVAHPWIASVLSFMALCRVWAKPLSSIVHAVVDLTPNKTDDGFFNALLGWFASPLGRKVAYLIDWLTSIKIVAPGKSGKAETRKS